MVLLPLGGTTRVDPDRVLARMRYEHSICTAESVAAQRRLPEPDDGTVAVAGAYHGRGSHEDGCAAGARTAASPSAAVSGAPRSGTATHSRGGPVRRCWSSTGPADRPAAIRADLSARRSGQAGAGSPGRPSRLVAFRSAW